MICVCSHVVSQKKKYHLKKKYHSKSISHIFDSTISFPMIKGKKGGGDKKRKNANIRSHDSKPKNIRSMFAAAAVKAKPKSEVCVSAFSICFYTKTLEAKSLTESIRSDMLIYCNKHILILWIIYTPPPDIHTMDI